MRGNPGRMFQVVGGINDGKIIIAYHKDQTPEFAQARKICFWADIPVSCDLFGGLKKEPQKRLISIDKLKLVGFVD